jgi:hypothetical protein
VHGNRLFITSDLESVGFGRIWQVPAGSEISHICWTAMLFSSDAINYVVPVANPWFATPDETGTTRRSVVNCSSVADQTTLPYR